MLKTHFVNKSSYLILFAASLLIQGFATPAFAEYDAVCSGGGRTAYFWHHGDVYSARLERMDTQRTVDRRTEDRRTEGRPTNSKKRGLKFDCENVELYYSPSRITHSIECRRIPVFYFATYKMSLSEDKSHAYLYDLGLESANKGYETTLECGSPGLEE